MSKHLQILLAGIMVVVPFAITLWLITAIIGWIDSLGVSLLAENWPDAWYMPLVGLLVVIAVFYTIGLLTHFWLFQKLLDLTEKIISRLPGIKTIYESVRDLLQLFGGEPKKMGKVVEYQPPGTDYSVLGIMTNENPQGCSEDGKKKVAVYMPLAYMIGGPVVYVSPENLKEIDMPVETALKLAATAHVGPNNVEDSSKEK